MAVTIIKYPKVFVLDAEGKPLLPCHPARARKLLKVEKATVERGIPFTIRLKQTVEKPVGSFRAKIDDGSKYVGIALVNEYTKEAVFRGTLLQRGDVVRLITLRREYRRNRRYRKVRYRLCRNRNRKQVMPPPSIRQKKEAIHRVVKDLAKLVPICGIDIELVTAYVKNPSLDGDSIRDKLLNRDKVCVICGSIRKLQRHHLVPRAKGGTDTPYNQILLCSECHRKLHMGELCINAVGKTYSWTSHVVIGKSYLLALLSEFGDVRVCNGWQTKKWREAIGLPKSHTNDAVVLFATDRLRLLGPEYLIWPLRRRRRENNPTKTYEERKGFKHWDVVRAVRAGKMVFGCIRSLKTRAITLRTIDDDNFEVSYLKTKLLHRPCGLVYVPVW